MQSAPGYMWGGVNFYLIGTDAPMKVENRSESFKNSVKSIGKSLDIIQVKMGDDQRARSFSG